MTETGGQTRQESSLREKLEWLMLFRLVLVTFLLGSAVIVNVNDVESFNDPSYIAIVSLIVGTYVATLLYAYWIRRSNRFVLLTYGQLVGDAVLAAGLVMLTGGIHSIFTFLFFLTIFNGAVLLGRAGAMFAASCSSLGLAAIVILQFGDFEVVWAILPEAVPRSGRVPVYALIIHLVGFFTVAALSGYLAEKLGQVGSELERRRMDIKELRALNENIVRSLASGLLTLDNEGRTTFFNEAAELITGYPFSEVNLRPLAEVIPEFEKVVAAAPAMAELSSRPRVEQRMIRPDGAEVFIGISISALRNAQGDQTGYILIFQDVTELKTMEAAIIRQEHLSAIGKLSAAIAHEIRNPLASISGSIEMLAMLLEPPAEERQLMDIVIREVDRLNGLIEDFLEYARPAQTRRKPTRSRSSPATRWLGTSNCAWTRNTCSRCPSTPMRHNSSRCSGMFFETLARRCKTEASSQLPGLGTTTCELVATSSQSKCVIPGLDSPTLCYRACSSRFSRPRMMGPASVSRPVTVSSRLIVGSWKHATWPPVARRSRSRSRPTTSPPIPARKWCRRPPKPATRPKPRTSTRAVGPFPGPGGSCSNESYPCRR